MGQPLGHNLVNLVYDPLVSAEQAAPQAAGGLLVHYQAPLVDGDRVFMMFKDADAAFDPNDFASQCWGEESFQWKGGQLVKVWQTMTSWKAPGNLNDFWEPVFHPALANGHLYTPEGSGGIARRDKKDGSIDAKIDPFSGDPNTFVVSPLTADDRGNVYYNAIKLQPGEFFASDVVDSWLVKVAPSGATQKVSYSTLVTGAPKPTDPCTVGFYGSPTPWPPATGTPTTVACGSIRVALNVAPAVAADGTIYSGAVTHFYPSASYLVAVGADLKPRWSASLAHLFHDGCGMPASQGGQLPPNGQPNGCSVGAAYGVDPVTGEAGSGQLLDSSSASPVIAPDGSVLLGTWADYNYAQGHLVHFSADGKYLGAYPFGWDITPAIAPRGDDHYSIVLKDNHYGGLGAYCFDQTPACSPDRTGTNPAYPEAYFVTQLDESLHVEWQFRSTNTDSCSRDADGGVDCVSDHPRGFEWCMNAPVIDGKGVVYANSEDGWLYAIEQGGAVKGRIFQQLALGAAYTPTSLGPDGKIYSQNDGHLFVVGR